MALVLPRRRALALAGSAAAAATSSPVLTATAAATVASSAEGAGASLATPAAAGNQVHVNASKPLTQILPAAIYGVGTGRRQNNYAVFTHKPFTDTIKPLKFTYFRVNLDSFNKNPDNPPCMTSFFPTNTTGAENLRQLDNLIAGMKAWLPPGTPICMQVGRPAWFSTDGTAFTIPKDTTSARQLQRQYHLIADYMAQHGAPAVHWQCVGELGLKPDGSPGLSPSDQARLSAIMQRGIKQASGSFLAGGPGEAWWTFSGNDLTGGYTDGFTPEFVTADDYYAGKHMDRESLQDYLNKMSSDLNSASSGARYVRQKMTEAGLAGSVPIISIEYNSDTAGGPANATQWDALYCAEHCHAMISSDANVAAGAIWELGPGDGDFGLVPEGSETRLIPTAYMLGYLGQHMGGTMIEAARGDAIPSTVHMLHSRAGGSGSRVATQYINLDTSKSVDLSIRPVGWAASPVTKWEQSPADPNGRITKVAQESLSSTTIPAGSVVVITGVVA
jgi:hypothetical protein